MIPTLFRQRPFHAAMLAEAVNHYVALGERAGVGELVELSRKNPNPWSKPGDGFSVCERFGWICRILFSSKTAQPLREPRFGGLQLPYHTMPPENWPLRPVIQSNGSYFLLAEGYSGSGIPEENLKYLSYCRSNGIFRKHSVSVPTRDQAQRDAVALRQSATWRAIRWKDRGEGWSYTMSEEAVWDFIHQRQAGSIT